MTRIESKPEIFNLWNRVNFYTHIRDKMVCVKWKKTNPEGFFNFHQWVMKQLAEKQIDISFMKLLRLDESIPWSSENCELIDLRTEESWRTREWLKDSDVILIRKQVKKNKTLTIQDLAEQYNKNPQTISDAVRGVTYQHLNEKEEPVIRRPALVEEYA